MSVIKDLVPDLTQIYRPVSVDRALAEDRDGGAERERPQSPGSRQARRPSGECILCLSCSTACPSIGGTATAISVRRSCCRPIAGSRTAGTRRSASGWIQLEDPFRLYRCHTIMNCTKTCPKGLNPAKAIAEIKKLMLERR